MSSPVEKHGKEMEGGESQTQALKTFLVEEGERLENIFVQNHEYTASQLAGKISFLEESIRATTPALLRASKLHEIIQRILDIRHDENKSTKEKDSSSKQPGAPRRVRHKVPAHDNPHPGTIPKAQSTQQTRIFLFHFRARLAALLKEYQKIMDHDVPDSEPTYKPKDPVPVTLAEAISDAIAAGRVKIIVTGTGEKEDLSESESRCHCSRHSTMIEVLPCDSPTKLHYIPEYTRRVVKDREIREVFFAKTPEGLEIAEAGKSVEASENMEENGHDMEGVKTPMRQTDDKGLGGKSNVSERSVKKNVTITPDAKTRAAEMENGNGTKPNPKSKPMAKAGAYVPSLNPEHHVQDISTPLATESLVSKDTEQSTELPQDQPERQEQKGTKDKPMDENIVGEVPRLTDGGQEGETVSDVNAPSTTHQGAEGSGNDEGNVDFVILGENTLTSDTNSDDDWVCVGDDGF